MNVQTGVQTSDAPSVELDVLRVPLAGTRLIEASAGTGKTWNICGLYLRLLLEKNLSVAQILVVSFTKAATAELRERLRSRVHQTLACLRGTGPQDGDPFVRALLQKLRVEDGLQDADMALRLDEALQTFDESAVFTIHSFCQRALSDTPFTSGVPMRVELLADDADYRLQVVHDFWRRHLAAGDLPAALAAYWLARKDTPARLSALLKRQVAKPLSRRIWPAALDNPPRAVSAAELAALDATHQAARALWQADRMGIVGSVEMALPQINKNVYSLASIDTAAQNWDLVLTSPDALANPSALDKLDLLTSTRFKPNKKETLPPPHAFFALAADLLAQRAPLTESLLLARLRLLKTLLEEGPAALQKIKRQARVSSYDDLLVNLHQRLFDPAQPTENEALAQALLQRFPAALIDEFQDTDPLQFAIFNRIYGEPKSAAPLFLVGDPKQAIYSFRQADLHTYLRARSGAAATYTLLHNQRSSAALLTGLNTLLATNPRAFVLPGLAFHAVALGAKARPTLAEAGPSRSALQLWALPRAEDGTPLHKSQAMALAAQACAAEIARLLAAATNGQVEHAGRPLSAGDIAVLVRTHRQGRQMRQALQAMGVGCVENAVLSIFDSPDAQDLQHLLAAILQPTSDRVLRRALATDLLGFQAHDIEALDQDDAALLEWTVGLADCRQTWLQRGVGVMLRQFFALYGSTQRLLARPDGERRLTNLRHLSECLHDAAAEHAAPEALLRWLQQQRQEDRHDDASQQRLESDRHLVQIVTFHKAKGLEYPFVFCPFLWDGTAGTSPRASDGREYHDDNQLPVIDFRSLDSADESAIKDRLVIERMAENARLVYVALTRAVQRCVVVMGPYTTGNALKPSHAQSNRSVLNWLVAGAGLDAHDWLENKLGPDAIETAWADLWMSQGAVHTQGARPIGLSPLPTTPGTPLTPRRPAPESLAALTAPAHLPAGWRVGSYSSLVQGARFDAVALDHDLLSAPAADSPAVQAEWETETRSETETASNTALPTEAANDDDILWFPRGPAAGECLHAVFENIDFTQPAGWPAGIERALRAHPQTPAGHNAVAGAAAVVPNPARLSRMLQRMLHDVLHTALSSGTRLAQVAPSQRLVEMEFNLPAPQVSAAQLAALLRLHGMAWPDASAMGGGAGGGVAGASLHGYLRGFIDLIFEDQGRFYILDWKSNHLGMSPADYTAPRLAHAMNQHGYHLQYLLYSVALHRYLAYRLPNYRYEAHFGGVLYLFVRGVRPGWRDSHGQPCGIFATRPPQALVEQLGALLSGPRRAP